MLLAVFRAITGCGLPAPCEPPSRIRAFAEGLDPGSAALPPVVPTSLGACGFVDAYQRAPDPARRAEFRAALGLLGVEAAASEDDRMVAELNALIRCAVTLGRALEFSADPSDDEGPHGDGRHGEVQKKGVPARPRAVGRS